MCQQLLLEKNDPAAVPLLEKLAHDCPRDVARLHALCTLDGLSALRAPIVAGALADKHPGVRRHAIRLVEQPSPLFSDTQVAAALLKLADDADPQVRMQLAYTLGEWNDPRAAQSLARLLLAHGDDTFLRAAAISSIGEKNIEEVMIAELTSVGNGLRAVPQPGEKLSAQDSGTPRRAFPTEDLLKTLLGLAASYKNERALVRALDTIASPVDGKYAPWQIAALTGLLDALDRQRTPLASLGDKPSSPLKQALAKITSLFEASRATMADAKAPESERLLATWLLGRGPDRRKEDIDALGKLLVPQTSSALQAAIVDALGRLTVQAEKPDSESQATVTGILLAGWPAHGPQLRGRIVDVLIARESSLQSLLTALERGQVRATDIDAVRRQSLLTRLKGAQRERAEKLLAGATDPNRGKVVAEYQAALSLTGDNERGAAVFKKSCAACHKLADVGTVVGPDLSALTDRSPQSLLVALFDPNRAVEAKFLNYTVATQDGRTLTGMLLAETGNSLTLVGQEGKQQIVLRSEIAEMAGTGKSLMPEGMEKDLPPQAVSDLVAFLSTQGPPRKTFAGNQPEIIKPTYDGSLRLLATNAEIYGKTLIFEQKYRNLGYWQSENDAAAWSIEVTQPGAYAVSIDYACDDANAGNVFVLQAGAEKLSGRVAGTGNWDTYKSLKPGQITLAAGPQRIIFRPQGAIQGAMIDLREVKLMPVKE